MSLDDPLSPQPPSIDKRWLQVAVQRGQRALSARQSAAVKTIANEITQRVPQRPEGWVLLARDSQQQCDPKAMVRYAQRAQKAAQTQLALKVLVIEATIANGAIAQAIALLDDLASQYARLSSAQHAPSQAGLRQVATLYTQLGRHHDAYRCIARLVSQTNVEPASHFMLAQAALTIGRLDEARGILDSVIAANSNEAEAQLARSNLRRVNVEHNHINSLKQSLSGLEPRDAGFVPLCYALGKEFEDLGDSDAAFTYFARGAKARRAALSYDVQADIKAMANISDTFDNNWWQATEPGAPLDAPVFILGLPRSGSTLIDRIIGAHPEASSLGEINDFAFAVMRAGGPAGDKSALIDGAARADMNALSDHYLGATRGYGESAVRLIDKTPGNFLYLGLIMKALPNARIIHIARHPVAAGYAMYKTLFRMGYPFSYDLADIGSYWLAYDKLMAHWRALAPTRILEVSYEALIDDQACVSRELLAHCGLDWSPQCMDFHSNSAPTATASAAQVRHPLYRHARDIWRNYQQSLAPLANQLISAGVTLDL